MYDTNWKQAAGFRALMEEVWNKASRRVFQT